MKRQFKKIISIVCTAAIFCGSLANQNVISGIAAEMEQEEGDIHWELQNGNTLVISGTGVVTASAFSDLEGFYDNVSQIIIHEGITQVEGYAFGEFINCNSIEIPASCIDVTNEAGTLYRMESIVVDAGNPVYCAENNILYSKDKTKLIKAPSTVEQLEFADNVKIICANAFENCRSLTDIIIPAGVEKIETNAFIGVNLNSLEFAEGSRLKEFNVSSFGYSNGYNFGNDDDDDGFFDNITDLDFLENTKELEVIVLGDTKLTDVSVLKQLTNLRSVSISSCCLSQEFFNENVEYQITLSLGERLNSSYYPDGYGMNYNPDGYELTTSQGKLPLRSRSSGYMDVSNISLSLLNENRIADKAGTDSFMYESGIKLKNSENSSDYTYAEIPVTVTVVDWNTAPELENHENFSIELDTDGTKIPLLKDANNQLWEVVENDGFQIESKAEGVKEYVAESVYFRKDSGEYNKVKQNNILYLTEDNTLYSDDKKVAENVTKYDKFYALTESGELRNMRGETVMTDIRDFISSYFNRTDADSVYTYEYLILDNSGNLKSFVNGDEENITVVDTDVVQLQQGGFPYRKKSYNYGVERGSCGAYLKSNGELYNCLLDASDISEGMQYEKADTGVKEILTFNVVKKMDNSIWMSGYQYEDIYETTMTDAQPVDEIVGQKAVLYQKKLFGETDKIVSVYNVNRDNKEVYAENNDFGQLEDLLFADESDTVWGFDENGNKVKIAERFGSFMQGGFTDKDGNRYLYKEGVLENYSETVNNYYISILEPLIIKDNVLYYNGIEIMTEVTTADYFRKEGCDWRDNKIIFARRDGTVWILDYTANGDEAVPVKIASFVKGDNATNITVENADGMPFTEEVSINVADVTNNAEYGIYAEAAGKLGSSGQLFDITMTSNGVAVQPEGKLKVSIPLPEGMSELSARVYHIDKSGTATDMNAVCEDGKLTFTTDHFSVYAVVSAGIKGDANGDGKINILDSALVRRAAAGWDVDIDRTNADVNGDGKISILDSAMIRRYAAGWDVEFK